MSTQYIYYPACVLLCPTVYRICTCRRRQPGKSTIRQVVTSNHKPLICSIKMRMVSMSALRMHHPRLLSCTTCFFCLCDMVCWACAEGVLKETPPLPPGPPPKLCQVWLSASQPTTQLTSCQDSSNSSGRVEQARAAAADWNRQSCSSSSSWVRIAAAS